jgi:hypothetical protein
MNALFLACALCCAQAGDDPLLKQLDADFEALLKTEKEAQKLREAAQLLATTDGGSHWTNYSRATALLRGTRARASIPLLLKYLVKHTELRGTYHVIIPHYCDLFETLTGKAVGNLYADTAGDGKKIRAAVERLVNDWWKPGKDRITTDIGRMTEEQVQLVTERLISWAGKSGNAALTGQDVHPRMIPVILARSGYLEGEAAKNPPERETFPIPHEAALVLAALRKDGEAPGLEKIAGDERQNSAVRLLCLMALSSAGEDVPLPTLLAVLDKEKKLERRLLTIRIIGDVPDVRKAVPKLLSLLDDPNASVRTAALEALSSTAPPEALPKVGRILDELHSRESVRTALGMLGRMQTPRAKAMLATFLEGALEDARRAEHLYDGLSAFETATGQRWVEAGAHSEAYYRQKAREALKWWKEQQQKAAGG